MPAKRRHSKRRGTGGDPDMRAWAMTFRTGFDYLHSLRVFGIDGDAATDDAIRANAEAAWRRLGADFLAEFVPPPHGYLRLSPWALEQFGKPPAKGKRNASETAPVESPNDDLDA